MAEDGIDRGRLSAHVRTYDGVITMLKWGTVISVLLAALVIWLIAT
ncbi:aa3-type cytochrome c oxidase subunit IV [Sphingomonas sp.]|nr:aa3-type cytochrome c oxidase subunit IV [Sphingomonas sp.]HEU0043182.1 aa3-type cytochrome c oxidase subunit IV [Sphingomonas sp.]